MDKLREEQNRLTTWSLVVIAAFVLAASLYYTRAIMIPFVLSVFATSMVSPMVDYQVQRLRFPRIIAVAASMLVVLGMVALFLMMLVVAVQGIQSTVGQYSNNFSAVSDKVLTSLQGWGVKVDQATITEEIQAQLPQLASKAIGTVTSLITNGALVLVFAVFLLTGRSTHAPQAGVYAEIDSKVRRYLAIKVTVSAITGVLVWILLSLLGLELAFLFGILTFLLNFIPSLGSVVATLLPLPVAIAQFDSPWMMLAVLVFPGMVQIAMGNLVEPKLQGAGLKLHPVVILLSLALWGLLWGIAGMVLAVPMTAIIRIVLIQFETTKPVGHLMAGQLPSVDWQDTAS